MCVASLEEKTVATTTRSTIPTVITKMDETIMLCVGYFNPSPNVGNGGEYYYINCDLEGKAVLPPDIQILNEKKTKECDKIERLRDDIANNSAYVKVTRTKGYQKSYKLKPQMIATRQITPIATR